jgi:hypothetical protein
LNFKSKIEKEDFTYSEIGVQLFMPRYSKPIHEMIREAMKSLGGKGSIQQVTDWIRSRYPDDDVNPNTISTAISDLSINGPPSSSYPTARRFLFRVDRGYYRMAKKGDVARAIKKPRKKFKSRSSEGLFRERDVQEVLCKWFENRGYVVIQKCIDDPTGFDDIRKCRTSAIFGIDIVAQKGNEKWMVEAKGETKGGTASGDVDLMCGIGQLLTYMKKIDEDLHYAIAIPNTSHFANALKKLRKSAAIVKLKLNLFLVNLDGKVLLEESRNFHMSKNKYNLRKSLNKFADQ